MTTESLWNNLFEKRHEWAFKADAEYRKSFHWEALRRYDSNARSSVVAVFGPSQVGKTTLILKLLGISEESFSDVYKALRGSRSAGTSATATSMIYKKSPGSKWRIEDGNKEIEVDESDISNKMDSLREKIERGNYSSTSPITMRIPGKYFSMRNNNLNIDVIDLPGTGSSSVREHQHVNEVVKKYIKSADIILLIVPADRLTSLSNLDNSLHPEWRYFLKKYRFIFTWSISQNSLREKIKNNTDFSDETLRAEIFKELKDSSDISLLKEQLYPIEYGDSWKELKTKEPDLYRRVEPVVDSLFERLIEDINNSSSPLNRLKRDASDSEPLKKYYEDKISALKDEIKQIDKEKVELNNKKSDYENRKIIKEMKCKELVEQNEKYNKERDRLKQENISPATVAPSLEKYEFEYNKKSLYGFLDEAKKNILDYDKKKIEEWNKTYKVDIAINNMIHRIENIFTDCTVEAYNMKPLLGDKYWNNNKFEQHKGKCISAIQMFIKESDEFVRDKMIASLKNHIDKNKEEVKKKQSFINKLCHEMNEIDKYREELTQKESQIKNEISKLESNKKQDEELAKKFQERLQKHFQEENQNIIKESYNNGVSPAKKFFYNCYRILIKKEYNELSEHK